MKKLTKREEEIMNHYWEHRAMFIKELQELYDEPKPHVNTLSTMVRTLEQEGYIGHEAFGGTFRYFPKVSREEHKKQGLSGYIRNYFNNSYRDVVSQFVKDEKISIEELKEIIQLIEKEQS